MKKFKGFLKENALPTAFLHDSSIDVAKEAVRQEINAHLAGAVPHSCVTPYAALEKVMKVLAYYHIYLPKRAFLEGDRGVEVYEIKQYGDKMGMNDKGEFITTVPGKFHLVFHYRLFGASFMVSAKIVDAIEMQKELDHAEATVSENHVDPVVVGSNKSWGDMSRKEKRGMLDGGGMKTKSSLGYKNSGINKKSFNTKHDIDEGSAIASAAKEIAPHLGNAGGSAAGIGFGMGSSMAGGAGLAVATGASVSNALGKVARGTETGRAIGKGIGDTINKYAPSVGNAIKGMRSSEQ